MYTTAYLIIIKAQRQYLHLHCVHIPFRVFTATSSVGFVPCQSVRRPLYTTPNSPATIKFITKKTALPESTVAM